ncbi:oxidoreductase family, NAD-binding Rossmann fold protein [Metarhizium rileyi]|uniref:Oxidoreductase family, NAD-binding Rossmann fold protein n=1 Tax=Metarhizium rileyi (strain RCEF 4871) TaxID=1649241 RepID=A0A167EMZ0_METRR|nr:oxidoreductase family, NAD-binding Rossmann fold protein [Metarhizium rileyi RCEF 4871]
MAQSIGVAIIGSGLFVKAEHLSAVLENTKLELKANYSHSLRSAQETASQIRDAPAPDLYSEDSPNNNRCPVAENFRFVPRFLYAAEQARESHPLLCQGQGSRGRREQVTTRRAGAPRRSASSSTAVFTTSLLLRGEGNTAVSMRAFTSLTRSHLLPVDTVSAIARTESGAMGTYYHSAGSLMSAFEWDVACEKGSVRLDGDVTTAGGHKLERTFERTSGVTDEVDAWAGILEGKGVVVPMQSAGEALADLEFLEGMFGSGGQGGEEKRYLLQKS